MSLVSLYDEASLWMSPSGSKDGKIHSEKPTDGTGDFTFSRGSDISATRVNANGYIEKGYENTLLASNDFARDDSSYTITIGEQGYDGTNDAWLVNKLAAAYFSKDALVLTGVMTISFYAKAGSLDRIFVFIGGEAARFDLTNGTAAKAGGTPIAQTIELVLGTTDWYRCSITINKSVTTNLLLKPQNSLNQDVVGTIYIQDAQLEIGLVATDYIESGATTGKAGLLEDEPRFDYSGGATCPSLLLEPSRTQYIPQTEYLEGLGGDAGLNFNYNDATSPEGLTNAVQVVSSNTSQSYIGYFNGAATAGDNTFSVFAKYDNCQYICLRASFFTGGETALVWFDIQNGTKGSSTGDSVTYEIEDYGNGWYRCYVVHNVDAGDLSGTGRVYLSDSDGSFNSALNQAAHLYGNQWEAGSYPTSYIPNHSGGTITRGVDDAYITSANSIISSEEGVLFCEVEALNEVLESFFEFRISNGINQVRIQLPANGDIQGAVYDGAYQALINYAATRKQNNKIAFKYKANDFALFLNGVKVGSDTSGTTFSANFLNRIDLGNNAKVNQALVFPTALTDSELIELTINGVKEDLITAYKKRATTLEEGASERLDTYLQSLEDFIII